MFNYIKIYNASSTYFNSELEQYEYWLVIRIFKDNLIYHYQYLFNSISIIELNKYPGGLLQWDLDVRLDMLKEFGPIPE